MSQYIQSFPSKITYMFIRTNSSAKNGPRRHDEFHGAAPILVCHFHVSQAWEPLPVEKTDSPLRCKSLFCWTFLCPLRGWLPLAPTRGSRRGRQPPPPQSAHIPG
jgi:hypothetical protein